ncbi:phosphatidate cytidylyltransferase [Novipirellula artificiosorum]|uniref:Phosphatidate cytidylyltransferase n=1 Tax=Novipirellula artificiosorum TaxID=2528016 RepID=A0A5C6DLF4_9BACT|nr:phosphatidate cytidylyltransferase [Novipirellula artificiosorum]TWU37015.1 Phosphatidate cytidylyltransferase [Novipirellula artificiosorum]
MLIDRLKTSALLIVVICTLVYMDATHGMTGAEGLWLLPVLVFFSLGTAWDLAGLIQQSGRPISPFVAIAGTATVTLSACVPMLWPIFGQVYPVDCEIGQLGWIVFGVVAAVMLAMGHEMWVYGGDDQKSTKSHAIGRTCSSVFVSSYVAVPMALLVSLRMMGSGNWGLAAILTTLAVTKSSDAGAYFVGRALGRHKLIPRLSPGKTIEGAIGGIATSTIVAFVCLRWLFPAFGFVGADLSFLHHLGGAIVLGPVLAVSGMLGDLAESLVKRDADAKDSGQLLPGLGGVWDVTDSLIAAIMPAFLCFSAGVAGPIV